MYDPKEAREVCVTASGKQKGLSKNIAIKMHIKKFSKLSSVNKSVSVEVPEHNKSKFIPPKNHFTAIVKYSFMSSENEILLELQAIII